MCRGCSLGTLPITSADPPMSSQAVTAANCSSISNTQLAASMAALGFLWRCQPLMHADTRKVVTEFFFSARSQRPGFEHLTLEIARQWSDGLLEKTQPNHPLCVMMRGQHNYNRGLEMLRGARMRLKTAPGSMMTVYRPGEELEAMKLRPRDFTEDFALAMALAGVGLPVVDMDGTDGSRRFWLPLTGYVLTDSTGVPVEHDARLLMQKADATTLAIQTINPLHPVSLVYDALQARAEMKRQLTSTTPLLVTEEQSMLITVHPDYTGRVGDHLSSRLGAPFIP